MYNNSRCGLTRGGYFYMEVYYEEEKEAGSVGYIVPRPTQDHAATAILPIRYGSSLPTVRQRYRPGLYGLLFLLWTAAELEENQGGDRGGCAA